MNVVGIDLGQSSFKAVELKKEKGSIELFKYGLVENTGINLLSDNEEELEKGTKLLSNFFSEVGFSTPHVIASLPETSVFTRVIKVPKMSEKELKTAMTYEAEQYIPLPLKDVNFDFQILDDDTVEKESMSVLLVAASKVLVNKYVKVVKNAKLTLLGLEPETIALTRIVGDSSTQPNPSIIVSIDSNSTDVIVTYKGIVRFSRNIATGGNALTRALAQNLGFDFSQAEEYKKTYGLDINQVDGKVYNAIKPVFDIVVNEIKRAFFFYTTHNPGVNIRRVVVCGGTALMPGVLYYLTNNLNLEIEMANPWQKITIPQRLQKEKQLLLDKGPFFVSAAGLALKDI